MVWASLQQYKLQGRLGKCLFVQAEVQFLRHNINLLGIQLDPTRSLPSSNLRSKVLQQVLDFTS